MAFQKVNAGAISLGDGKNGTVKQVTGFLAGIVRVIKKHKRKNFIYAFMDEKGKRFEVFGSGFINNALAMGDLNGQLVRLTYRGLGEKKKGQNRARIVDVEHDPDKKPPAGFSKARPAPEATKSGRKKF